MENIIRYNSNHSGDSGYTENEIMEYETQSSLHDNYIAGDVIVIPIDGRKIEGNITKYLKTSLIELLTYTAIDCDTNEQLYVIQCNIKMDKIQRFDITTTFKTLSFLADHVTNVKHMNLISYQIVQCMEDDEDIKIFLVQDFVHGRSIRKITDTHGWNFKSVRMVAKALLNAIIYIRENNLLHNNLIDTSVLIDNTGTVRVTDFVLLPHLQNLPTGRPLNNISDLPAMGLLLENMVPMHTITMKNFIDLCKSHASFTTLLEHPFLQEMENSTPTLTIDIQNIADVLTICGCADFGNVPKLRLIQEYKISGSAIKRIPLQKCKELEIAQFLREVQIISKLNHKNVIMICNYWIEEDLSNVIYGYANIEMDFYTNTLRTVLNMNLSAEFFWKYINQIARGLSYIHEQGVVHRNLSPDCIFLDTHDNVKIGGFFQHATAYLQNVVEIGTELYVAPELKGKTYEYIYFETKKVDVFALGQILMEMILNFKETDGERDENIINNNFTKTTFYNKFKPYICDALNEEPSKRPTVNQLLTLIEEGF